MESEARAACLDQLQTLLTHARGFHDGILKEVHWVNRDFVATDLSMHPYKGSDLRMLIQRQAETPSAVELTLFDVRRLSIDMHEDWISHATATTPKDSLVLECFGLNKHPVATFAFHHLEYRFVDDWLGPEPRL